MYPENSPTRPATSRRSAAADECAGLTRILAWGEIDMRTADRLHGSVLDILRRHRPRRLQVDLTGVTFLDAAGIRALLKGHAAAARMGCRLTVVNPRPIVYRVLEIVGLLETFGLAAPS